MEGGRVTYREFRGGMITIIAGNTRNLKPGDAESIRVRLRELLGSCNVRIASSHVEISIEEEKLAKALDLVNNNIGPILYLLRPGRIIGDVRRALELYETLVLEERFWEAHEILEFTWRSSRDDTLRSKLKTLIKIAATLAKVQEGKLDVALSMARSLGPQVSMCIEDAVIEAFKGRYVGSKVLDCVKGIGLI